MTKEQSEEYGRKINAQSAKYENVKFASEKTPSSEEIHTPTITEDEIKKRVGAQNYKNMKLEIQ